MRSKYLSQIDFLKIRLQEITSSPAWSGQARLGEVNADENTIDLEVRSRFVRDWVQENHLGPLQQELSTLSEDPLIIRVVIQAGSAETAEAPEVGRAEEKAPLPPPPVEKSSHLHDSLKLKYRFDNFVVGPGNQFAHAAAQGAARDPGKVYNPLFLYGGVGLGKTHLLNAVGLDILRANPRARILYVTAEQFMNEMIHCTRFGNMGNFKKKYRESCDVLLIDDIQFIAGKERTQDEFFHTFNHLHNTQRQIVMTSDKMPNAIPDLEERLSSRFGWGLIADIQPPELETRMAILKRKAGDDRIAIDDDVILYLATYIKSNVRELEGSLTRLNALASLTGGKVISLEFAKDALKSVIPQMDRALTVEQIQKHVADFYKIKMPDLIGHRRMKSLALPRQIAMYLSRKHVGSSYPEIGDKFGGKDHSTVVHAFQKIEGVLETDTNLRDQVSSIEQFLL